LFDYIGKKKMTKEEVDAYKKVETDSAKLEI